MSKSSDDDLVNETNPEVRLLVNENGKSSNESIDPRFSSEFIGKPRTVFSTWISLFSAVVMGFVFGFVLEKGRVFEPSTIVNQMRFKQFLMLKMFLSAVGSSLLSLTVLSMVPAFSEQFKAARFEFLGCVKRGLMSVSIGAFILGIGMSIAGACPGTVLAQIGAGIGNAPLVFLGGLIAAFLYAYVEPFLKEKVWPVLVLPNKMITADQWMNVPYAALAIPFCGVMIAGVAILEHYFPWKSDYEIPFGKNDTSFVQQWAWPPFVAGAIIGINQIPAVIFLRDTIGSASSYATIVSNAVYIVAPSHAKSNEHFSRTRTGLGNAWQVVYVVSAILGALSSSNLSGAFTEIQGVSVARSIIGGFLILFGSRIAGGCTSGHGISGMGLMFLSSFVAIPAMFAGGIATAAIVKHS